MTESNASLAAAEVALNAVKTAIIEAIQSERERCAKICQMMIVGGRAWTEDQEKAARVLEQAAANIRNANNRPHRAFEPSCQTSKPTSSPTSRPASK